MAQTRGFSRRDALKLGALAGLGLTLPRCHRPDCPIGWQPSVRAPVFYGIRDLGEADGAPGPLRLFYPSIEGSPWDAPALSGCGGYPLILFAHGHCGEVEHYKKWYLLPAQLARCGFVVAAPQLPATAGGSCPWSDDHPDLALLHDVMDWVRNDWADRGILHSTTGVVGHSYGALLGARFVTEIDASAYASLSGVWQDWPGVPPRPLGSLGIPALVAWGSEDSVQAILEGGAAGIWNSVDRPKHKLVFEGAGHWDYLTAGASDCEEGRGPCTLTQALAADFVAVFLSKTMPPEDWTRLRNELPESLVPPPLDLTEEQEFFAGGHLSGLAQIADSEDCSVTHLWVTAAGDSDSITLP